jgi:hypothetical protein
MKWILYILLFLSSVSAYSQVTESARALVQPFDQYRRQTLPEKLFVHTDQAFYLTGETLWFKAYYVDGSFHKPLDLSKVAYIEVIDSEQKPVLQTKVALATDGGNGSLFLPASLNSGNYLLRAYTNWMKNFSTDFFFEKPLTIVNPFKPLGLPAASPTTDYDIQLFPEGGHLVQGLPGKVAFKVADALGRGVAVRGWLLNEQNDTLSRFASYKFGIGTFTVTPSAGTAYRVVFADEKGHMHTRPLPAVQAQGYTMRVEETAANQLNVHVHTNVAGASSVYLFAHTRNDIKVAEMRSIDRETVFLIDKNVLGEGISHLTVFNADRKPVCERVYFKRPTQQLRITLKPNQSQYASRTTVGLDASVLASAAKIHQVSLSVSVYRVDSLASLNSANILSYLWMTSDLRGTIDSPDYYLQPETDELKQATDNLMLTHGWRRFRWNDVLAGNQHTKVIPFLPEHNGLLVQGTVTEPGSGKPVSNIMTFLSVPGKPVRLYTSKSDSLGKIRFEMPDLYGSRSLIVQTNPQDSLYKLTIANPFSETPSPTRLPAFSLDESKADQLLNRSVAMQVQSTYWGENAIRYQYPAVDSAAFYGKPSESYLLDAYTRFPRMEEVLREYVLGVMPRKRQGHFRLFVPNAPYRTIFENPSLVLMDGVPIFDMDKIIEFSPLKIKQLDVITNHYFIGPAMFTGVISFMTYKGDLAGFPLDSRLVKVDYDGLQLQREFYTPSYATPRQQTSRLPDGRTLLYWNPNLKINARGNAHVDFPTSDQTGTYVVEVNGLSTQGLAGSQRVLFEVKNTPK